MAPASGSRWAKLLENVWDLMLERMSEQLSAPRLGLLALRLGRKSEPQSARSGRKSVELSESASVRLSAPMLGLLGSLLATPSGSR